ncbi:hypothetical protein [Syntrophorhabdus aromaticivorans]|jgi:hypothetical protein|nr:hypothetical protein [Syntrophorhabdus aromaticivorans]
MIDREGIFLAVILKDQMNKKSPWWQGGISGEPTNLLDFLFKV